jgi:hypothetical protein
MSPTLSTLKTSQGVLHITKTRARTDSSRITASIITTASGILIITSITTRITVTTTAPLVGSSTVTNLTTTTKSEIGTTTNSDQTTTTNLTKTRMIATIRILGIVASTKACEIPAALGLGVRVEVKAPAIRIVVVILDGQGVERGGITLGHNRGPDHAPRSR